MTNKDESTAAAELRTVEQSIEAYSAANIIGAAIFLLAERKRKDRRADAVIAPAD